MFFSSSFLIIMPDYGNLGHGWDYLDLVYDGTTHDEARGGGSGRQRLMCVGNGDSVAFYHRYSLVLIWDNYRGEQSGELAKLCVICACNYRVSSLLSWERFHVRGR